MNKVEEIFKSWMISFDPNADQADIASKRIEICDSCEYRTLLPIGPFFNIAKCSICGCALKGKMYTPLTHNDPGGTCPRNKWSDVEDEWILNKQKDL